MSITKLYVSIIAVFVCYCSAFSQIVNEEFSSVVWDLGPEGPQVDLKFGTKCINIAGYEDTAPLIKNNFADELSIEVQFTLNDYCGESRVYTVTKVLRGHQVWAPNPFMEGYSFETRCKTTKEYGTQKKLKTRISRVDWEILSLRNLTEEKTKEAEGKARKERDAAAVVTQGTVSKSGTDNKSKSEADAISATGTSTSSGSSIGKESKGRTSGTQGTTQNEVSEQPAAGPAARQAEAERAAEEAEAKRAAEEAEAKRAAEEAEARERQSKYDEWKREKNEEREIRDAASVAASATFLYYFGGIIYDGMGSYNPDFSYEIPGAHDRYKPVLYAGVEVGFSATYFPMLFNSSMSTMVNGNYVTENSISNKGIFTINLNVTGKVGLESEYYGAYAYFAPQAGFVPTFNGYSLSFLCVGGRAYGGLKWVKAFADYSGGGRQFSLSSLEIEEYGNGKFSGDAKRIEYGLRFSTNPDFNYRRSHFSIGLISETYEAEGISRYLDPESKVLRSGRTPVMRGYTFQWKKDHAFNLWVNVFPTYLYGGEISTGGPISKTTPESDVFVELGFIRSFDFFSTRLR